MESGVTTLVGLWQGEFQRIRGTWLRFYDSQNQLVLTQAEAEAQRAEVEAQFETINQAGILPAPIVTRILDEAEFYDAETYHQNYYQKNPARYKLYRVGCGRDKRVAKVWSGDGNS